MILSIIFAGAYAALLIAYRQAWRRLPERKLPEGFEPKSRITVLIPARNEAGNIGACLNSIGESNYPSNLLEIIVIDDFSEDETSIVASEKYQVASVVCLADQLPAEARFSPNKKKAIEIGVARAKGGLIVTTDADCIVPKDWLMFMAAAFENPKVQMLCAPVVFHREQNLLQRFQSLDFLGLMGISGAGYQLGWHKMANGANLAFRKQTFETVGAYTGNDHLASGDDMFLAQKVAANWPGSVVFLKSLQVTVLTEAAPDLQAFWQQRLRWGTKNAALPDWPLRLSLLTVFLLCCSIWVNLIGVLIFAGDEGIAGNLWIFLFQLLVKAAFDYFFLAEMCRFFKRKDLLQWFIPSFFLHTAYIPLVGIVSLISKKYTWKGRHTR